MQRRAIRDAKTPDKMKKSQFVKEDSNLTLQEKKDKIQSGLKKLTELGTVDPKNRYQELINDIAKVLHMGDSDGLAMCKLSLRGLWSDSSYSDDNKPSGRRQIGVFFSEELFLTFPTPGFCLPFDDLFHDLNQ